MVSIASEHKHLPRIMFMLSKPMLKPEKSEQSSNVSFAWFTIHNNLARVMLHEPCSCEWFKVFFILFAMDDMIRETEKSTIMKVSMEMNE